MAGQIVSATENEPHEALNTGKDIDGKLRSDSVRTELAEEMVKSRSRGGIAEIRDGAIFGRAYEVDAVKVIVGGSLYKFDVNNLELAQKFTFKNMVLKEDVRRIYAQMKNGCRGNLVIIELGAQLPVQQRQSKERVVKKAAKAPPRREAGPAPGSPEDTAETLAEWRQRRRDKARAEAEKVPADIERGFNQAITEFEQFLEPIHRAFYEGRDPLAQVILDLQDYMEKIEKRKNQTEYAEAIRIAKAELPRFSRAVNSAGEVLGIVRGKLKIIEDRYKDNFSTYPALGQQYRERAEAPYSRLEHAWKAANAQLARINGIVSRMESGLGSKQ